jgi:hypothetical protein
MARKRFNSLEKALIASGAPVEWQNVTQWHPATITDPRIITEDGWQHVLGVNQESTARLSKGTVVYITPGHVRARQQVTS